MDSGTFGREKGRGGSVCTNTNPLRSTRAGSGTQNRMGLFQVPNSAPGAERRVFGYKNRNASVCVGHVLHPRWVVF